MSKIFVRNFIWGLVDIMKTKNILTALLLFMGALLCTALGLFITFSQNCEDVCNEVLRLHIPANSNSAQDQTVKLELRDYLLNEFGSEFSECADLNSAEELAEEKLSEIEHKCTEFLSQRGFDYGAKAEVVSMYFTTREYDRLILPAGKYKAIRVTLGKGEGENWWCVIFPQLCLPAVSEKPQQQDSASDEVLETFGKPQRVTVKFALYELLCKFFS